jgi:hypothetical protein
MTIIQWLSETIGEVREWLSPMRRELVPVYREPRIEGWRKKTFYIASIACAVIGFGFPLAAWTADFSSLLPATPRMVVAAGVGYENAESSTITVKTYDAENGAILSDETYELNVREDAASVGSQPRERIFAGGVGPGTDGLSTFTLRVYDAATGRFLWEGLLNLSGGNQESDSTYRVVAHLAPQATVTRVHSRGDIDGQPKFFLRAVDLATGQLVWTDHFSAGAGTSARAERVNRAIVNQTDGLAAALSQQIEFRIRMMDDRDRQILWEDTIEPTIEETEMVAGHDAEAENLPVWRGEESEEMEQELI